MIIMLHKFLGTAFLRNKKDEIMKFRLCLNEFHKSRVRQHTTIRLLKT
jgi:hypothetical protein